ncbi:MAG: IS66 family transposase [Planctomycetota bacterium]
MMGKRRKKNQPPVGEPIVLAIGDVEAILKRASEGPLSESDVNTLRAALDTLVILTQELEKKSVSIQRLKQMLFGASTETTSRVMEKVLEAVRDAKKPRAEKSGAEGEEGGACGKKAEGHGRNGAEAYTGATKTVVRHPSLRAGCRCPGCTKGKLYANVEPRRLVRLTGQAPVGGTVYELERFRCNLCGEIFSAQAPEGIGEEKYDAKSAAIIGLMKYGAGVPFNRLENLQKNMGIPVPAATQWEIVSEAARTLAPALAELTRLAAQGEVLHNDDTTAKVLSLGKTGVGEPGDGSATGSAKNDADPKNEGGRTGVFTSGIVSKAGDREIALFFTGRKHAGENLLDVLKLRSASLARPIQMCDALAQNMPKELETILSNCLAHGRRKFVEVASSFPEACLHVLGILKDVYRNDAIARNRKMSAEERLRFHQAESGPRMEDLKAWMSEQIDGRLVEPNSALGGAIAYMQKYWDRLTLFLRVPGAPCDNNVCERALKKAILHRKNAYFYRTENGAHVGDLFMSLIHTCELNGANPFEYLTELQEHAAELRAQPIAWMPWNYKQALEAAQARPAG